MEVDSGKNYFVFYTVLNVFALFNGTGFTTILMPSLARSRAIATVYIP